MEDGNTPGLLAVYLGPGGGPDIGQAYYEGLGRRDTEVRIRDLILGRRCTHHYTCNALSGHSLSLLLGGGGGGAVNPRC